MEILEPIRIESIRLQMLGKMAPRKMMWTAALDGEPESANRTPALQDTLCCAKQLVIASVSLLLLIFATTYIILPTQTPPTRTSWVFRLSGLRVFCRSGLSGLRFFATRD